MPDLYIIAGPNGAGKSTFSQLYVPGDVQIFDGDKLQALREKMYPDIDAAVIKDGVEFQFEEDKREAIKTRSGFAYESNFSSPSPLTTAEEFRKAGYKINLVFLGLSSINIAISRVAARMELGGHGVDRDTIAANYNGGLKNLQKHIGYFDKALFYSSEKSKRLERPVRLVRIENGKVMEKGAKLPAWVQKVMFNLEGMKKAESRQMKRRK